ncbi:type II secretion system protein GspD [Iodidimonas muriae]|uniref:Type II secretion system protein GspD n=2 Tax=Iodidimonas muriae TaxID=261467 RepID=A0ABQ2L7J6_9PROT|nr:type II secretion system protein GspD [Kordiimonadales bacterium JCM 17843]GGO05589.1 type II secretion system protein GspD [Iodidimonas muriae]
MYEWQNMNSKKSKRASFLGSVRMFGGRGVAPLSLAFLVAACSQDLVRGSHSDETAAPPPGLFGPAQNRVDRGADMSTAEIAGINDQQDERALPPKTAEIYKGHSRFTAVTKTGQGSVDERDGAYTLNFSNADIRSVVDAVLGDALGLPYLVDNAVTGTITARSARALPEDKVIAALEDVLAINGAALVVRDGVYHVLPLQATTGMAPLLSGQKARQDGFGIHVIPIQFASADEMQVTLEPFLTPGRGLQADTERNLLLFRGPGGEAADIVSMVELFDVDWMAGMSFALLPLSHADVGDVLVEMEAIFAQDGETPGPTHGVIRFLPIQRMNALLAISEQPVYLENARQWTERLDRGGGSDGQRQLYVYHLKNARASEVGEVLGELFDVRTVGDSGSVSTGLAPGRDGGSLSGFSGSDGSDGGLGSRDTGSAGGFGGSATSNRNASSNNRRSNDRAGQSAAFGQEGGNGPRLIADERNDAMLVLATAQEYRMIEQTLKRLDITPLQVLIEATIAEVTLDDELNHGLRWFFEAGGGNRQDISFSDVNTGAVAPSFPGFSYFFESGDARVALNALSSITDVTVVSSPQLMVLDNKTARLQVGDQVPVPVQQSVSTQDPDAPIVNSIQFQDTGVILEVTPHVNASGLVVLEVSQEVSDVVPTTSSGIDAPTIQQRAINSSVAVQTGETIALGGLIRDRASDVNTGVPILMNIPWLGNLFKSKSTTNERTELLVLLTPQVVRDSSEAREVTQELRRRMKGFKRLQERFGVTDDQVAPSQKDGSNAP